MLNIGEIMKFCPSDLSKEEKDAITKVLYKNLMMLDNHRKRLLPLRSEILGLKQASAIVGNVDYTKACMRCRSSIPICFSGNRCPRCKNVICSKCQITFGHQRNGISYWMCSLCAKQRSFDIYSGDWLSRFFPKSNLSSLSLNASNQHSSTGSVTSLASTPAISMIQLQNRVKLPARATSVLVYRNEPQLESRPTSAPPIQDQKLARLRRQMDNANMSPIQSNHNSTDRLENDAHPSDTWAMTSSTADVMSVASSSVTHPGTTRYRGRNCQSAYLYPEPSDLSEYESSDAGISASQPNLFDKESNIRGSRMRRPSRRRFSNASVMSSRGASQSQLELRTGKFNFKRPSTEEPSSPVREIAVQTRFRAMFDGRSKTGGGVLRLIFEDCALVGSVIDIATSQICQFVACLLPRGNAGCFMSKSVQLSRKNDRLGLELLLPVYCDDTSTLSVHISLWLLKPNFLGTGPAAGDGRGNVKRGLLGEAAYSFNELMRHGSGERPVPLYTSLLEFPLAHASGQITLTVTLHSARIINQHVTNKALHHKLAPKRASNCDHLCLQLHKISGLLLPDGLKKIQIYCKALLLPIKTDHVKTKTVQFEDASSKLTYHIQQGGVLSSVDWPEASRQICVADMLGSQLTGGRCLELLVINKSKSGGILSGTLSGGNIKTVVGCIRLGSSASFDSTKAEETVWTSVIDHPDTPITATLPLRPNDGNLLNIVPRLH